MKLVHSVYYHASMGCPEAVPAGMIVVHLGDDADLSIDARQLARDLTSTGVFDDAAFQLGFTSENADLVRGSADRETFSYVVSNQIMPDWQFDAIASQTDIPISDHSLAYILGELEDAID